MQPLAGIVATLSVGFKFEKRAPFLKRGRHMKAVAQPVPDTLLALKRKLELLRHEHLEKNRSVLGRLDEDARARVELLTAAINEQIFQMISQQLEHSANTVDYGKTREVLSKILELASV